jgi:hypothetical protein
LPTVSAYVPFATSNPWSEADFENEDAQAAQSRQYNHQQKITSNGYLCEKRNKSSARYGVAEIVIHESKADKNEDPSRKIGTLRNNWHMVSSLIHTSESQK